MIGLFVLLGKERTKRMKFGRERITIGAGAEHDLVLRDGGVAEHHLTIELEAGEDWYVTAHAPVSIAPLAPAPGERLAVRNGTRIALADYTLQLAHESEMALDPVEQRLIAAIVARDAASREVYADWLEERGQHQRAEFLRLSDAAETGEDRPDLAERLRVLARELDEDWKARVSRPVIENCNLAFQLPCPRSWDALAATKDPKIRTCDACRHEVHYCTDIAAARDHAWNGHCVALDLAVDRRTNDLRPPPKVGRMIVLPRG